MKTLFVLSDTHGNKYAIEKLKSIMCESDYVIFLGDGLSDMVPLFNELGDKLRTVDGNCDFYRSGEREGILEVEGHRIFYTHGDLYSVKRGLDKITERAKELNADIVFYGHTHEARVDKIEGITLINPGSLRGSFSGGSYAYIVLHNEKVTETVVNVSV